MSRSLVISSDQTWHDHFIYFQLVGPWSESVSLPGSQTQRKKNALVLTWIMFSLLKSDKFSLIFAWQLSERNAKWWKSNKKKKIEIGCWCWNWIFCKMELTLSSKCTAVHMWIHWIQNGKATGMKTHALHQSLRTSETNTHWSHSNQASV